MKIFASSEGRRRVGLAVGVALLVLGGLSLLVRTYFPFLIEGSGLRAFVARFGAYAPVAFVALQAAQVVIAPIPGQVTGLVSGYLFGAVWGTIYSLIGLTIGSLVVFWLSRRYGRPFVEGVIDDELLAKFDAFVEDAGVTSLFIVFLVPGPPDDAICFMAGLTEIDLWKLVAVAFVGRLPVYLVLNVSGASLADENVGLGLLLLVVLAAISVWGVRNSERLLNSKTR